MSSITFNINGATNIGGGGNIAIALLAITATSATTTLTSTSLLGLLANKIISVDRSGILYNVVSGTPNVRECSIDATAGTITVNIAEPFYVNETVNIKKIA